MKRHIPIYLYGAVIIIEGIFLLVSNDILFDSIKLAIGIPLTVAAILAFVAAIPMPKKQVQSAYHTLHALIMLGYGISVLFFCKTYEMLLFMTSLLFIFYSFSEIIFCGWLFNMGNKIVTKIIAIRLLLGLAIGLGTVILMYYPTFRIEGYGILFIVIGINFMLYAPVMNEKAPIVA
jgi:hypothetical protein